MIVLEKKPKNLEKSNKIIHFSWVSLSELPYRKSQQPTCLLRVCSSIIGKLQLGNRNEEKAANSSISFFRDAKL